MKDITDQEFYQIRDFIKANFGINLSDEKKSLVYSRLRATLVEKGFEDFTSYFKFLKEDKTGDALVRFIDKITTNHTFFMREVDHFDYFRDTVLPYIEEKYSAQKDIRLWCAACSSGEEPYTLQMILMDYFKKRNKAWNTQILATDISTNVLTKAYKGIYTNESIAPLSKEWKTAYFKPYDDNNSIIIDEVKKNIVFRKLNLMDNQFPFTKPFQVIFCRNVMIYFDNQTRDTLVQKFYTMLEDGGYLFIGHSESLNHNSSKFKYVKPAAYRK